MCSSGLVTEIHVFFWNQKNIVRKGNDIKNQRNTQIKNQKEML
jgi:hypothetical protein